MTDNVTYNNYLPQINYGHQSHRIAKLITKSKYKNLYLLLELDNIDKIQQLKFYY